MRKSRTAALFLVTPLVLLGFAGVSQAQLVLYDDFNTKPINPAKWFGTENSTGSLSPDTEEARKIAKGQLEMDLTMYGRTDSNTGVAGNATHNLHHTNPSAVTTIQADVTIKSVAVVACASNPSPTRARGQMGGAFFNDGTSPGAGNRTGDIFAGIQKVRDTSLGDRTELYIARCTNSGCTANTTLTSTLFTAVWVTGVADTQRLQWDQPNHRFVYTLNPSGLSSETKTLSYSVSDSSPAGSNNKLIGVANSAANCLSGPRTSSSMKALFDNVMVNP